MVVQTRSRKDDAAARQVAAVIRSGGSNSVAPTVTLASTYASRADVWELDPATTAAWTATGINAIEAGIKTVA